MKAKKKFFMECHLAGRQYHDADDVWEQLKVGRVLRLERDYDNRYDNNAVAVMFDEDPKEGEAMGESFLLGYIPSDENEMIASMLEMGWNKLFECRICKINADAHYENQVRLSIKILRNNE